MSCILEYKRDGFTFADTFDNHTKAVRYRIELEKEKAGYTDFKVIER